MVRKDGLPVASAAHWAAPYNPTQVEATAPSAVWTVTVLPELRKAGVD